MIKINNVEITDEDFRELAEKQGFVKKAEIVAPNRRWRAQLGDNYYTSWVDGKTREVIDKGLNIDKYLYETGNYFQTFNEAESHSEVKLATQRVTDRLRELDGGQELDWGDNTQKKYYPCLDRGNKKLIVSYSYFIQLAEASRYSAKQESWLQVVKEMPDDVKLMLRMGKSSKVEKEIIEYLKGLASGTIKPADTRLSLCCCLEQEGLRIPKLSQIFESWSKYSGDIAYPIPDPKGWGSAYTKFCRAGDMWEGEYGDLRRELCQYIADYIKEHGIPS